MISTFKENFLEGKVAIVTGGATGILYGQIKIILIATNVLMYRSD